MSTRKMMPFSQNDLDMNNYGLARCSLNFPKLFITSITTIRYTRLHRGGGYD